MKNEETFAERIKRESKGYSRLDPKLVEREKSTHTKYLIKLRKKMGRALTEKELTELGTIL
jgi:hypothetical protein